MAAAAAGCKAHQPLHPRVHERPERDAEPQRQAGRRGPSFAYSLPVHSLHTRRDRVASSKTCRLHGAAIQSASPLGPGRAPTLPCGWNNLCRPPSSSSRPWPRSPCRTPCPLSPHRIIALSTRILGTCTCHMSIFHSRRSSGALPLYGAAVRRVPPLALGPCFSSLFSFFFLFRYAPGNLTATAHDHSARPAPFASRSVRRALLTPQVNSGSRYRCRGST